MPDFISLFSVPTVDVGVAVAVAQFHVIVFNQC